MGYVKLNIWLRDERCKPFKIQRQDGLDYVTVMNCAGEVVQTADVPVGEAHIELKVPPGCYVIQGHVCEPGINTFTDKAIVIAGCGQELCVDLIVPIIRTCVVRDMHAFVTAAMVANIPRIDIATTVRTILAAGKIPREEMATDIEARIKAANKKEAKNVAKEYATTLDIIRG